MDRHGDGSCLISLSVIWSRQWTVIPSSLQMTLDLREHIWHSRRQAAIQSDPDRLEEQDNRNLTKLRRQMPSAAAGKEWPPAVIQAGIWLPVCCISLQKYPSRGGKQYTGQGKSTAPQGCINSLSAHRLREGAIHLNSALMRAQLNSASSFDPPSARQTLVKWSVFNWWLPDSGGGWSTSLISKGWRNGVFWAWRTGFRRT